MRVSSKLSVLGAAIVALAAVGVREALSAPKPPPPPPPPILLWNRCCAFQSDTAMPGRNFGPITFTQNGSGVTGTFMGGTVSGVANGTKLKGVLTLAGDPVSKGFSVKLDKNTYDVFSGKI